MDANVPDWDRVVTELIAASERAIAWYVQKCGQPCKYFGFGCLPDMGDVVIGLDTEQNALKINKERARYALEQLRRNFESPGRELLWHNSLRQQDWIAHLQTVDMHGMLSHQAAAAVNFQDVYAYQLDEAYPRRKQEGGLIYDEYTESHFARSFWRTVEQLEAFKAFERLPRSFPFWIGYSFHDDEPVLLRVQYS